MSSDTASYDALIQFLYQAPIGLLQTSIEGEITMANPMAAALLMPLVPDGNLVNLFDTLATFAPGLRETAAAHDQYGELVCDVMRVTLPARPPERQAQTLSIQLRKLDGSTLMASVSDVTVPVQQEQQRLASKLRDLSRIDSLTSLPNRAVVHEQITHALTLASADARREFAVLFINIDRFSRVNITLGQAVGDELLRQMAGRLTRIIRPGDALGRAPALELTAASLGGDEFVVVMEGLYSPDAIHTVARRLVDALYKPYTIAAQAVQVSISLGVALGTRNSGDADTLLQDASLAMLEAKRAGGNRYGLFEAVIKERAARRGSIESDLRRAIAADELFVVYQPIINLTSGVCVGAEALVRWLHPLRGTVAPIEFIDIAEATGLIGELGNFVLNTACREFMRWKRLLGASSPRSISVNVSRAQLGDASLADQVHRALAASGMAAEELQLEVTESLAAQDETVQARLHELKALGVTLALDDFGTGYSSLACLHQLPVDVVKIDRSFVSQIESSAHHRVLVEATILVACSLGMGTVAEGIETRGQAAELTRLRCDKAQGYLFARPLPAEDVARWLSERIPGDRPSAQVAGMPQ